MVKPFAFHRTPLGEKRVHAIDFAVLANKIKWERVHFILKLIGYISDEAGEISRDLCF